MMIPMPAPFSDEAASTVSLRYPSGEVSICYQNNFASDSRWKLIFSHEEVGNHVRDPEHSYKSAFPSSLFLGRFPHSWISITTSEAVLVPGYAYFETFSGWSACCQEWFKRYVKGFVRQHLIRLLINKMKKKKKPYFGLQNICNICRQGWRREEKYIRDPVGMSMLEAARKNDIDLEGACEGALACSTLSCYCDNMS